MIHNLKTLYEHLQAHSPEATKKLKLLRDYCEDADELFHSVLLNRGFNSLKWAIYSLRTKIEQKELEALFVALCNEAALQGREDDLYDNILSFYSIQKFRGELKKPELDLEKYPKLRIGRWRVLINETTQNITSLIFNKNIADVIIFKNPETGSAGVVFRAREGRNGSDTGILNEFDISKLFFLLAKRGENWVISKERNLIICGGEKHSFATKISASKLLQLVKLCHINESSNSESINSESINYQINYQKAAEE